MQNHKKLITHLKHYFLTFLLQLTLFSTTTLLANDFSCDDLNDIWHSTIYDDFNVVWRLERFRCPSPAARIAQAFQGIYQVSFNGEGFNYYEWLKDRITNTRYQSANRHYPWAAASIDSRGNLYFHDKFVNRKLTPLEDESIIVHEGRHVDGDDPGHVVCFHGKHKGTKACDKELKENLLAGGGYNYQLKYAYDMFKRKRFDRYEEDVLRERMMFQLFNNFRDVTREQILEWEEKLN